jgi:hypothetical protein
MPRLTLIPQTPAPDTPAQRVRDRVKKMPKPAHMAQCPRCGGREFLTTKTGVLVKAGKPTGGTPNLICVHCLTKGERIAY